MFGGPEKAIYSLVPGFRLGQIDLTLDTRQNERIRVRYRLCAVCVLPK
jgi:hypothetical protein